MKKVAFVIYRGWAYEIYENILKFQNDRPGFEVSALITTKEAEFEVKESDLTKVYKVDGKDNEKIDSIISDNKIDVVFYYGWSWIVKEPILSKYLCLCLHPSPLPKYRGGSPIQNQIIAGEKMSAVSVFKIGEGLDDGDIYQSKPMSLDGDLKDIFNRMTDLGTDITKNFIIDLINDEVILKPQLDLEGNPPLKRRKKEDSEIKLSSLPEMSYESFNNIVRALADPYPNAYLVFGNKKVLLKESEKFSSVSDGSILNVDEKEFTISDNNPFYIKLKDGYALVKRYSLEEFTSDTQ